MDHTISNRVQFLLSETPLYYGVVSIMRESHSVLGNLENLDLSIHHLDKIEIS
jgi:hypothetical protein